MSLKFCKVMMSWWLVCTTSLSSCIVERAQFLLYITDSHTLVVLFCRLHFKVVLKNSSCFFFCLPTSQSSAFTPRWVSLCRPKACRAMFAWCAIIMSNIILNLNEGPWNRFIYETVLKNGCEKWSSPLWLQQKQLQIVFRQIFATI